MKKILTIFLLVYIITGCINYEQKAYLYPDGTGKMQLHYWMKATDSASLASFTDLSIFNQDSVQNEFNNSFLQNLEVSCYVDSADSTINTKVKFDFNSIDSLSLIKVFSQYQFSLTDGAAGQKVFSQFIPPIVSGFGIDTHNFVIRYIYDFHGEVISHNATSVDNRSLIWEYNYAQIGRGKTISVTFKPFKMKETPVFIYILAGIVLSVVIFYLFRKKRD